MNFKETYNTYLNIFEEYLFNSLPTEDIKQKKIVESMKYSIKSGGKRLRPILTIAISELFDGDFDEIVPIACAIELIHTYSLVHDDLPAMDNDDYRRGTLTNHKVYGEAVAILTGDALLNFAFEIMLNNKNIRNKDKYIEAMYFVAKSAGIYGMIGGQVLDIESEGKEIDINDLKNLHNHKTGALLKASILAPAIIYGSDADKEALTKYADNIGLAFQVKDDILDVEGDFETIGKPIGSDDKLNKSTFVKLYGLDKSKEIMSNLIKESINSLNIINGNVDFLAETANYIKNRNK